MIQYLALDYDSLTMAIGFMSAVYLLINNDVRAIDGESFDF